MSAIDKHYNKTKLRISKARHLRKPEAKNTTVFYDKDGNWLFEVYAPKGAQTIISHAN